MTDNFVDLVERLRKCEVAVKAVVQEPCQLTRFRGGALSGLLRDVVVPWLESEPRRALGVVDIHASMIPFFWEVSISWQPPELTELSRLAEMDLPRSD